MDKIEQIHKEFGVDVNIAITAFYTWRSINILAGENKDILKGLNKNALSWNIITHSLQNTFFIAMGRIFDTDHEAFSVHRVIRMFINKHEQFNKDHLRERKLTHVSESNPVWLENYIDDAFVPSEIDLTKFRGEIAKRQRIYEDVYRPIRNNIIAHKDASFVGKSEELFNKTNIGEIEGMLKFLYQFDQVFFQLIHNGRIQRLEDVIFDEEEYVKRDVHDMLLKLIKNT